MIPKMKTKMKKSVSNSHSSFFGMSKFNYVKVPKNNIVIDFDIAGNPGKLSRIYLENIEIKALTGNLSLPKKEEK